MDWTTGQEVSIFAGTFAGYDGTVITQGDDAVTVEVTMYGRKVPVEVPSLELRAGLFEPLERLRLVLDERMALATTIELNDWWVSRLDEPDIDGHLWEHFEAWRGEAMERRAAQRTALEAEVARAAPPADVWKAHLDEVLALGGGHTDDGARQREQLLERAFTLAQASKTAAEARRARA